MRNGPYCTRCNKDVDSMNHVCASLPPPDPKLRAAYLSGVKAGLEAAAQWHEYLKAECDDLIGDDETPATMIAAMMVGFHNGAIDGIHAIDPESVGSEQ